MQDKNSGLSTALDLLYLSCLFVDPP